MATIIVSWSGCLFNAERQKEFTDKLRQLAQVYNDIYFGDDKDETTLSYFDNVTIKGNISISKSLLNIHENFSEDQLYPLRKESEFRYSCSEIILYGVQFLIKSDINYTRRDKQDLDKLSYVFWGFNSTTKKNPLIKRNIAKVYSSNENKYELSSPFASARFIHLWFETYLYEFAGYYYFEEFEFENNIFWEDDYLTDFRKFLIENDPEANNPDIKEKAFAMLREEVIRKAKSDRDLDEIELKYRSTSSNTNDSMEN